MDRNFYDLHTVRNVTSWVRVSNQSSTFNGLLRCSFPPINVLSYGVNIWWRCSEDKCKKSCSIIRAGSLFEKSKLSLQQWLVIIHWWLRHYPVTKAAEVAKVSEITAMQSYQYLRDICSWRLTSVDSPLMLGGPGVVVQSWFRHNQRYYS